MTGRTDNRLEVWKGDRRRVVRRQWWWRIVGANGEVTAVSEGYTRRRSAIIAAIKSARGLPVWAQTRRGDWYLEREGTTG